MNSQTTDSYGMSKAQCLDRECVLIAPNTQMK